MATSSAAAPGGRRRGLVERRSGSRRRVPTLTVLWHPDLERVGEWLRFQELLRGESTTFSALRSRFRPPGVEQSRPLELPELGDLRLRIAAGSAYSALDLSPVAGDVGVRIDGEALTERRRLLPSEVEIGVVVELAESAVLLLHEAPSREVWEPVDYGMIGESEALVEMRLEIRRVADLEIPVLLRGETGTGKELAALAIHRASRRREAPFQSVNLGAIPPTLAASELFGAAKGAFTGAVRAQEGYFSRAHKGTLFLDEIAEASPEVQVMLLRALESGEIQPLGIQETQQVDVRLIAATDADLEAATDAGEFRAPLLHRLASYEIHVPPLRERRDDFGRLLVHFLRQELAAVGGASPLDPGALAEWLPTSVVARLARHDWPGNVRQVKNAARQLVVGSRGSRRVRITPQVERLLHEVPATGFGPPAADEKEAVPVASAPVAPARAKYRDPSEVGDEELAAALRANRWAVKPTARALGVSRTSLYSLIEHSPLVRKAGDLSREEIERCRGEHGGDLEAMGEQLEVSTSGLRQRMKELGIE